MKPFFSYSLALYRCSRHPYNLPYDIDVRDARVFWWRHLNVKLVVPSATPPKRMNDMLWTILTWNYLLCWACTSWFCSFSYEHSTPLSMHSAYCSQYISRHTHSLFASWTFALYFSLAKLQFIRVEIHFTTVLAQVYIFNILCIVHERETLFVWYIAFALVEESDARSHRAHAKQKRKRSRNSTELCAHNYLPHIKLCVYVICRYYIYKK